MKSTRILLIAIAAGISCGFAANICRAQATLDLKLNLPANEQDASDPNLIRVKIAGDPFAIPLTITGAVTPQFFPTASTPNDEYKYKLTQLVVVVTDGDPVSNDVLTEFQTGSQGSVSVSVAAAKTNRVLRLQASAKFEIADASTDMVVSNAAIKARYQPLVSNSPVVTLINDQNPPELAEAIPVDRFPGGGGLFQLRFEDGDLDTSSLAGAFTFTQTVDTVDSGAETVSVVPEGTPQFDRNSRLLTFDFRNLNPGAYKVVIAANKIKDTVGNVLVAETERTFEVPGGRLQGKQVEYPRHLTPGDKVEALVNPGDRVDTRDVRLYYFRDAHRVAEIINRNAKSLNQTGYDASQRFARLAREKAEQDVDERRRVETLAVQAAQATRATRAALEDARERLEDSSEKINRLDDRRRLIDDEVRRTTEANGLEAVAAADPNETKVFDDAINAKQMEISGKNQEITDKKKEISDAETAMTSTVDLKKQLAVLQTALTQLNGELSKLENGRRSVASYALVRSQESRERDRLNAEFTKAQGDVTRLESKVIADEQQEINLRNDVQDAEAKELRAEQERFRREVAAGLADRDTYAAGDLRSIDPVTQVTITVVGEGKLQLRGPVNGINKICRMVHQIDSPVGQVKIGIHTIQINGEHGDRMERVYEDIDKYVAQSRFLTSQSMLLFRKAVSQVAGQVATSVDQGYVPDGCEQIFMTDCVGPNSRDMKYMYAFFGRDFIDELRAMDSELLQSDNKLLSLHSMDTISLAGALQVAALANNTARQRIIQTFQAMIMSELAEKEIQNYLRLTRTPHSNEFLNKLVTPRSQMRRDERDAERLLFNAHRNYTFASMVGFFDSEISGEGTLNNVQYAVIRLAQTLKAQLIAEQELKNLVKELSLLSVRPSDIESDYLEKTREAILALETAEATRLRAAVAATNWLDTFTRAAELARQFAATAEADQKVAYLGAADLLTYITGKLRDDISANRLSVTFLEDATRQGLEDAREVSDATFKRQKFNGAIILAAFKAAGLKPLETPGTNSTEDLIDLYLSNNLTTGGNDQAIFLARVSDWRQKEDDYTQAQLIVDKAVDEQEKAESLLFAERMLKQFIDEQEEKSVELLEALRAHASNVDNYLKRLAIALEDDVNSQFYDPAFQKIRRVSRTYDVQLGQIETTTILTNNRTLAKVSPSATMEFDLPKREILITEAMNNMNALTQEYGNLLQNGTFLAGTSMLSGQPAAGIVGGASPLQQVPGISGGGEQKFGAALEALIPDPAVYKFETGTGFEIRPVIQPDGHSIVYTFDYLYTTNVREPVRADEKHLGRVKRHFVHTDVQTSSYELREVSRYTVALKASRTSRGVPGLEDVPIAGALFRPAASAESSLQENIILASSVIYPTVYDLMGLRWSPYVDDISSPSLATDKLEQTSRRDELRRQLLSRTRSVVDERIGISRTTRERVLPGAPFSPQALIQPNAVLRVPQSDSSLRDQISTSRPHGRVEKDTAGRIQLQQSSTGISVSRRQPQVSGQAPTSTSPVSGWRKRQPND